MWGKEEAASDRSDDDELIARGQDQHIGTKTHHRENQASRGPVQQPDPEMTQAPPRTSAVNQMNMNDAKDSCIQGDKIRDRISHNVCLDDDEAADFDIPDKYTEKDEKYMEDLSHQLPHPVTITPWYGKSPRNFNNQGAQRNFNNQGPPRNFNQPNYYRN